MTFLPWTRYLAYARETSYGDGTSPTQRMDIEGESLSMKSGRSTFSGGRTGAQQRKHTDYDAADGAIDGLVDFTSAGHWLSHLTGTPATTNPAGSAQQHIWTHSPTYRPRSLCLQTFPDLRVHQWPGAIAKSLKLQTNRLGHLVFSLGLLAQKEEDGGAIPSVDESTFSGQVAPGSSSVTQEISLEVDGTPRDGRGQLSIDFGWMRDLRRSPRFKYPTGILHSGGVEVSGKLVWRYDSIGEYRHDAYLNDSELSVTITWDGATISGAYPYRLKVELPSCQVAREQAPSIKGPGGSGTLVHSIDFVALASSDLGGSPFRVTLINTDATPASF